MSDQYKFNDPEGLYFTTTTVVDWIDVFTRIEFKTIILVSLKFCQENRGLEIYAWCLMSNHLHMMISAKEGFQLFAIMRDFKKFTSKEIVKAIKDGGFESRGTWMLERFALAGQKLNRIKNYKFWKDGNHPEELYSNKFIEQKLDYIHNNPVAAMIVEEPEHYLYSSARDYVGQKGLLDVVLID